MSLARKYVVAIGQLPPPTDGLAVITAAFVRLMKEDHDVETHNISPRTVARGPIYHLSRMATVFIASFALCRNARKSNRVFYMPCQSDFGLVYTIYLLAIARLLRYPTYLHHHNFGYIYQSRALMKLALLVGGRRVNHIFLCDHMIERFSETYWRPLRWLVISNAAFVSPRSAPAWIAANSPLTLGLLSNLNHDKGLYLFLDLLRASADSGLNIRGILAGPARNEDDRNAIDAALQALGDRLTYAGPIYGEAKDRFYDDIDVFVFPTLYANEAQPTVLYEAMAAGSLLLTYDRGCIASQVGDRGLVIPRDDPFVPRALAWIRDLHDQPAATHRQSIADGMTRIYDRERLRARHALSHES